MAVGAGGGILLERNGGGGLLEGNKGGGGGLSEGNKSGGGGLSEGSKGGGGGLSEGNKSGGGGLSEGSKGGGGGLAGVDGEKGDHLEKVETCSTSGREAPVIPDLHGFLIPGPGAALSMGDGVARRAPPIKIDFSRKGRGGARALGAEGTPGFSKNFGGKTVAGGSCSRVGFLKGCRILPLGFKKSSQEQVSSRIKAHGGQVSSLADYYTCTHICLGNELNKILIAENWISLPHDDEPEASEKQTMADLDPHSRVRRELFPASLGIDEDKIRRQYHQLFHCMNDQSDLVTLAAFAQKMRKSFVVSDKCPGTIRADFHRSTLLELKLICKEAYMLLKALKIAGYTLGGNFNADNFVLVERVTGKGLLFGQLRKDSLELISSTSPGEKSDEKAFKRMALGLLPQNVLPPHDLVTWLGIVGRKDMEWLLLNNWTLLKDQDARERFLYLCGKLHELYENIHTREIYDRIVGRLDKRGYRNWQERVESICGNNYLRNTLNRVNPDSRLQQEYKKHAGGLLLLLRNCRHHYAKAEVEKFLMIVADNFPNLLMDFQEEMYIEGFIA